MSRPMLTAAGTSSCNSSRGIGTRTAYRQDRGWTSAFRGNPSLKAHVWGVSFTSLEQRGIPLYRSACARKPRSLFPADIDIFPLRRLRVRQLDYTEVRLPMMAVITGVRLERRSKGANDLRCWHVNYRFCGVSAETTVYAHDKAEARREGTESTAQARLEGRAQCKTTREGPPRFG
jgi:hypothetical protein